MLLLAPKLDHDLYCHLTSELDDSIDFTIVKDFDGFTVRDFISFLIL